MSIPITIIEGANDDDSHIVVKLLIPRDFVDFIEAYDAFEEPTSNETLEATLGRLVIDAVKEMDL